MASTPRVVAELGRPETPEETAARKAESSRIYRGSQTARNLIAALLATVVVVFIVVLGVPRGDQAPQDPIDVAAVAKQVENARDVDVVVPTVPTTWSVNGASVDADDAWTIIYAPPGDSGFVRVGQALGADETWTSELLRGAVPTDTTAIGGVTWDRYKIADPASTGNVTGALGVTAGADQILVYGDASAEDLTLVAGSIADQVRALQEAAK